MQVSGYFGYPSFFLFPKVQRRELFPRDETGWERIGEDEDGNEIRSRPDVPEP